jgi:hypothetical protein
LDSFCLNIFDRLIPFSNRDVCVHESLSSGSIVYLQFFNFTCVRVKLHLLRLVELGSIVEKLLVLFLEISDLFLVRSNLCFGLSRSASFDVSDFSLLVLRPVHLGSREEARPMVGSSTFQGGLIGEADGPIEAEGDFLDLNVVNIL